MKERKFEGNIIFEIDSDGDKYESFKMAMNFFKSKRVQETKYYPGFFDSAYFYFQHHITEFKLEYSGFMGTELKVNENISVEDLFKVRQWVEEIYKEIHKNESSK